MNLSNFFTESKSKLTALLNYANEKTGADDVSIGDAIKTLADGFGQGGGDDLADAIISRTITEITSNATKVGSSVFVTCNKLESVNMPLATTVDSKAFFNCPVLKTVNLPLVTTISSEAFYSCSNITMLDLPLVTTIQGYAFQDCFRLKTIDLPSLDTIQGYAFSGCSGLIAIILRKNKVCDYRTPSSSADPKNANLKIYVPRELLESYKTATNWLRLASKFVALEDYTVDGTTTGEMNKDSDGNIIPRA